MVCRFVVLKTLSVSLRSFEERQAIRRRLEGRAELKDHPPLSRQACFETFAPQNLSMTRLKYHIKIFSL